MTELDKPWKAIYGCIISEEVTPSFSFNGKQIYSPIFTIAYNVGDVIAQHIVELHNNDLRRRSKL